MAVLICACQPNKNARNGKLKVVTTTGMIYDAVINIAGDSVEALALMGPGVDPHLYKATQGDLKKLQEADLIFYNGLHLEGKMGEIFEKLGRIKSVKAVSEDITTSRFRASELYPGTYDPHIWFDVSLWKEAVKNVHKNLILIDDVNKAYYDQNAVSYLNSLDSLHLAVNAAIQEIPESQRMLITAHDAFGYFGEAYNIEVKGLQGISTLSEPGLKDVADLVNLIVENEIKAVFIETSVSKKAINAVVEGCKQNGHDVIIGGSLYSDAMGPFGQFEGTYIGMVHTNVQTIVNALK
ncbi:manganese/zinc/iron transport system substrate-binding protein [Reichenbachiella faecimaris]|uniref:Manganese/zinc/iron transport system substrate-binding protein n=1 Tax=Reichenbachiella faecimaris TaxID=692418 RepID=A0A1W2G5T4_REIFA|nr:zinc ABC transporter substrate-binding protein [Reichenbachiella faecimaris]SMD31894.1 manganese/zinc/iron transport system substrate-binding protein [Reichenbachiella faecimaris]